MSSSFIVSLFTERISVYCKEFDSRRIHVVTVYFVTNTTLVECFSTYKIKHLIDYDLLIITYSFENSLGRLFLLR